MANFEQGIGSGVFQLLDPTSDIVSNRVTTVSSGIWSNGGTSLSSGSSTSGFFQSNVQSASSGEYYVDVHQEQSASTSSEVQFSVAFGHYAGSGSLNATIGTNPSLAIHSQFKNVIVSPTKEYFQYGASGAESNISAAYFISVARARMREKVDPGNWEIRLAGMGQDTLNLIDDSDATLNSSVAKGTTYFNIVSGSISTGQSVYQLDGTSKQYYGRFYPYLGVWVFDGGQLDKNQGATLKGIDLGGAYSVNTDDANHFKLLNRLNSGSVGGSGYFQARREEDIKSTHFFCRVHNGRYNFSQNPTYYTGSGDLINPNFVTDPRTYITTVGLYNANSELLALAKLSKPFLKTPAREAVIKVRLDF
jgi:hypothetical protein